MKMTQVLAAIAACVVTASVSAQRGLPPPSRGGQQPPLSPTQFRASVDLIHLDVSVLDNNRRPVRGLAPADFTLLENGVPQNISVFTAVDIPDVPPPATPWMREVAPDVRTNDDLQERRLFLIIIDDAAIESTVFGLKNVKDVARRVVDRFGPSDLAALVFTRDNRNSQDFTTDRGRLLTAIDKFTVGFRGSGGPDDLYYSYSVNVVQSAVEMLSNLPDRRKAIIYIGQGIPVNLEQAATPALPGIPAGGTSALSAAGLMLRLQHQMSEAFKSAARANVNVYPIDICGLRVEPPPPPWPQTCRPGLEIDYVRTVAANTGGRAVINTNDFGPGVEAIFVENASYYLLGYQSTDARRDGKFRRMEVRVNRPGVFVRTRTGYDAEKPDAAARRARLAESPLGTALSGVLPKSDLPMQLTAAPFAIAGKSESAVAIALGIRQPIRPTGARTIEKVDLQVSAFNVEGKLFGSTRLRADVVVRAGATGLAEYDVLARLDLKPGRYQLRVAANVGSLSTSGSLYYDVDVPDFSDVPVSLSGVAVTAMPAPTVAPKDGFKGLIPVVPTTRRSFNAGDRAVAFMRVYQGGKRPLVAVPVHVRLLGSDGAALIDRQESIEPVTFTAARSADVNVELPIARLKPGAYLLTVESTVGKTTARRDLRFEIR